MGTDLLHKMQQRLRQSDEEELLDTLTSMCKQHRAGSSGALPSAPEQQEHHGWPQGGRGRGISAWHGGKGGRSYGGGKGAVFTAPYPSPTCFTCGEVGHYANACPKRALFQPHLSIPTPPQPNTQAHNQHDDLAQRLNKVNESLESMVSVVTSLTHGIGDTNKTMASSMKEAKRKETFFSSGVHDGDRGR